MKSKIQKEITTLEAIQEGLDWANDINAIGLPRHLISEMIKEKKKNADKIHLEFSRQDLIELKCILRETKEFKSTIVTNPIIQCGYSEDEYKGIIKYVKPIFEKLGMYKNEK